MHRLAWLVFMLCLSIAAIFIVATTGELPDHVASHFGPGNTANGFMTRGGYLVFMLAFALVLPIFVAAMVGLLPRVRTNSINIPHRAHWLEPKRREATLNALSAHGAWLGSLIALFIVAIHYVVLVANRISPPRLPADLFRILLIAFLVGIALWIGTLFLRFRNLD
jgi:uncharacterized membrane protein